MQTCRAAGFSKIHAFPFSARRGTPAAEMADQLPKELRSERVQQLTNLETELRGNYFRQLVGRRLQLLVESTRALANIAAGVRSRGDQTKLLRGTTCRYAPAELVDDFAEPHSSEVGQLLPVTVRSACDERLFVQRTFLDTRRV